MNPLRRENDRLILCSGPPAFTRMNRRRIYEILFVNTFGKGDLPSHEGKWIERRRQRYRKDDSNEGGMRRLPVYPVHDPNRLSVPWSFLQKWEAGDREDRADWV